jgi:small subunit ribosomal protein S16
VATKIRLKRLGKIRTPHYRVVVMDSHTKRDGRPIEEIGQYHPKTNPSIIKIDSERARYWLGVGAQPTEAVVALLKRTGDWQAFTGDTSPSGIDEAPSRPDKQALFDAALAEADKEPGAEAISRASRRGRKAEEAAEAITEALEGKPEAEAADESAPQEAA